MVGLGACRFLIVDSNDYMRQIIEAVLRGFGARHFAKAKTGEEALEQLQTGHFDIITTDYLLPALDGAELTRLIRRWDGNPNRFTPIIMISAFSPRSAVETARDAGVSEFCCKPLAPRDLFRRLVAVVDHSRAFVQSQGYVGPDRRRRQDPNYAGPDRRFTAAAHLAPLAD